MKNIIRILALTGMVSLCLTGCQKYDHLIPDDFGTILSLKQVGEIKADLYTTGEDGVFDLTILKGGADPASLATAELSVMSAAELEQYAARTGKRYEALPSTAYTIDQPVVAFDGNTGYATRKVTLKTTIIQALLQDNPGKSFALPLVLVSQKDSVNAERNVVLLKPSVLVPILGYDESAKTLDISAGKTEYELRLSLPFVSPWDFDATMEIDESAIPEGAVLIPSSEYEMSGGGKVTFKKGSRVSEPVKIALKPSSDLLVGNRNVLPLRLTGTTISGMKLPEKPFVLTAEGYNQISLTVDMLSTNAQEPSEGPIKDLIDGDPATYFHSAWSVGVSQPHYVEIALKEPIKRMAFKFQNRANANGKAQEIKVLGLTDSWEELETLTGGMPTGAGSIYSSKTIASTKPFSRIRLVVMKTNSGTAPTFFNMAELFLYGK